jgi:AraC-like DNA-binding protein
VDSFDEPGVVKEPLELHLTPLAAGLALGHGGDDLGGCRRQRGVLIAHGANLLTDGRFGLCTALTGLSRSSFARQFKQHSGRSFSEFLNGLRLEAACRELLESGRPVLDIALGAGFTQVSFFNRLFRRTYGCSPSAFRTTQGQS